MNTHDKYELSAVPYIFQYGQYNEDDLRQPDCRLIPYRDFQEIMQAYARSAIEPYAKRIAELEAARIAYASEFAPDEDGEPDVGRIHENIRKLKADRKRRDEPVGYINPAHIGQGQGSGIFWTKDQSFNKPVYEAPQPAERSRGEPVAYVPLVLGSGKPEWSGTLPIGHELYEMHKDKCPWKPLYTAPQPEEPLSLPVACGSCGYTADPECLTCSPQPAEPVKTDSAGYTLGPISDGGMDPRNEQSEKMKVPNTPTASLVLEDGKAPEFRLLNPPEQSLLKGKYGFFLYTHPQEPVKVPSDSAIMFEWSQTPNTGDMRVDLIAFAHALLTRYGQPAKES